MDPLVLVPTYRGNVRVFGGYTPDRNNVDDPARQRIQVGAWMANVGKTGLDINVTEWRVRQAGLTTYNSLYVLSGTVRVNRQASVLCDVERMDDSTSRESCVMAGLTYRFREGDRRQVAASGSRTVTVVPRPSALSTPIVKP